MELNNGCDNGHVIDRGVPCCQKFCGTPLARIKDALDGVFGNNQVHYTMLNSPEDIKPGQEMATDGEQCVMRGSYWLQFLDVLNIMMPSAAMAFFVLVVLAEQ